MTKKELQQKIVERGGTFRAKDTKEQLAARLAELEPKHRRSSKEELRSLFAQHGKVTPADIEAIAERLGVKAATVRTALVDLRHPVYAKGPVVKYEKKGAAYVV